MNPKQFATLMCESGAVSGAPTAVGPVQPAAVCAVLGLGAGKAQV
jgi:hypothetical protein